MRLTLRLSTVEGGRYTVRSWHVDVPAGGFHPDRLELLVDGDALLNLPLGLPEYDDDEDLDDDE